MMPRGTFFSSQPDSSDISSKLYRRVIRTTILALFIGNAFASSHGDASSSTSGFTLPIQVKRVPRKLARRGEVSGSIGLGNNADLLYNVPIKVGNTVSALHLGKRVDSGHHEVHHGCRSTLLESPSPTTDTGSSDLWIISDQCRDNACEGTTVERYPRSSLRSAGADVQMFYGDSMTGTFASGQVGVDTATVAGVAMVDQPFGLINDTSNAVVQFGTSGIFGLGFPAGSKVQEALTNKRTGSLFPTDNLIRSTYTDGPLLSRISMTRQLEMPMFTVTLQRSTIDIDGEGLLTVGKLPDGIDNSTLTWVPVRLYNTAEGGLRPPSFAPNEVYPFRWEIDIDAVYLNGRRLADSAIPTSNGVDARRASALIDTGNSILRGPEDVVNNILTTVSPSYNPNDPESIASFPCETPQTLAFEIGGKIFPIDPRDFIGQIESDTRAANCAADNIVPTDPPAISALFRWSLGTPFFRSNLVAFHYGNLTHPSVDPPRIGIRSNVPANANELLRQAVQDARNNGGNFEQTLELPPTEQVATEVPLTISSVLHNWPATTYTLSLGATPIGGDPANPTNNPGAVDTDRDSGAPSLIANSIFFGSGRTSDRAHVWAFHSFLVVVGWLFCI